MRQFSSYSDQSYAQSPPAVLDPANRAWAAGQAGPPSLRSVVLITSLFSLVALIVGTIFVWQALTSWLTTNELTQSGVSTMANVVNSRYSVDSKGYRHFNLTYSFTVAGTGASGKPGIYQKEASVTRQTYDSHPTGSKITIRYLPANPTVSDVADQPDPTGQNLLFLFLAFFFYVMAAFLAWVLIRRQRLYQLLRQRGQFLPGYILSSRVVRARGAKGRSSLRVEYGFVTPQGNHLQGKQSFTFHPAYYDSLNIQPNSPVVVAYADDTHYQLL